MHQEKHMVKRGKLSTDLFSENFFKSNFNKNKFLIFTYRNI